MIDNKESQSKQEILRQGQQGDFWQIIVGYLKESKEHLRNEQKGENMKSLPAEEYKLQNELLLARLEYLDRLSNYPNTIIGWLQNPDNETINHDPYEQ